MKTNRTFYDGEGVALADNAVSDDGPVWNQIAKQGSFAGHVSGPFKMDLTTFEEIVTNFKATQNRAVPIDYEHASEADPTSGTIPLHGAPATGWIRDLRIEDGNLWGLVEWSDQAREQIRAGQYKFFSPAIVFGKKDRVTGKPCGAYLSSGALVNTPFLDGMQPLAAKDGAADDLLPHHHATNLRRALADHDCSKGKCLALAHCAKEFLGCYSDDDEGGTEMGDRLAVQLRDAQGEAAKATLLLRDRDETIAAQHDELVALRTDKASRDERDLVDEVDTAFRTHKDKRKLSESDKPLMLRLARADRSAFRSMYPHVELEFRHLLRDVTPPEPRPTADELDQPTGLQKIERGMDAGLSYAEAAIAAAKRKPTMGLDANAYRPVPR